MNNGIDKKALFNLKSEPYLKPISDLGIGFYNLDENVAKLIFQLKNSKGPLLLGKNHLKAYSYFESENGSSSNVVELNILDELNGVVEIVVPKEFLQASTGTKVIGQVYVGVNNAGDKINNQVAVFGEFSFEVRDALINKISSFTKVEYIRMFDQLKERIEQKVLDIENAIANGADYVAEMKSVLQHGIETFNEIANDLSNDLKSYIEKEKLEIKSVKDTAIKDIETKSNSTVSSVRKEKDEAINYVSSQMEEFNTTVSENGFATQNDLDNKINSLDWQRYRTTNDDGTFVFKNIQKDLEVFRSLPPGEYYTAETPISGMGQTSSAGFTTVYERSDHSVRRITFRPYNSSQEFVMRYYQEWSDWEKISFDDTNLSEIQKFKLTEDNGNRVRKTGMNVSDLPTGFYQVWNVTGLPEGVSDSSAYWNIDVTKGKDNTIQIFAVCSYIGRAFLKNIHKGTDLGWQEITPTQDDTGWINFSLLNGAMANTEYSDRNGFECSYRIVTNGSVTTNYLRINGRNFTSGTTIAQLPSSMVKNSQSFMVRTPTNSPVAFITINNDGSVVPWTLKTTGDWTEDYYIYNEISWIN